MIENIDMNLAVKELPEEKKFEVTFTKIDKHDATSLKQNIEQIRNQIANDKTQLSQLDAKVEMSKKQLTEQITSNEKLLSQLEVADQKARIWAEEEKKFNEERGVKPQEQQ